MASSTVPVVVLKSTTSMSLNERFTEMLTSREPMRVTFQAMSQSAQQQDQLDQLPPSAASSSQSSGNRKLVQEMESRPSVQAALALKPDSLKQRLGKSNIRAHLGWPFRSLGRRAVGGWRGTSHGGSSHEGTNHGGPSRGNSSRGGPSHKGTSRGGFSRGSYSRGSSSRGGPSHEGRSYGNSSREGGFSRAARARGEIQGEWVPRSERRESRGAQAPQGQEPSERRSGFGWRGSTGHRGHTSNMATGKGPFEGSGRPCHVSQAPLTKEQLDAELDAYMAH